MAKKKYTDGVHVRVLSDGKGGKRKYNCTYKNGRMVSKKVFATKKKSKKSTKSKKNKKMKFHRNPRIPKKVIKWEYNEPSQELTTSSAAEIINGELIVITYNKDGDSFNIEYNGKNEYDLEDDEIHKIISKRYGKLASKKLDLSIVANIYSEDEEDLEDDEDYDNY